MLFRKQKKMPDWKKKKSSNKQEKVGQFKSQLERIYEKEIKAKDIEEI